MREVDPRLKQQEHGAVVLLTGGAVKMPAAKPPLAEGGRGEAAEGLEDAGGEAAERLIVLAAKPEGGRCSQRSRSMTEDARGEAAED